VIIYFTTNERWYSRLARWLEGEEPTHIGIGLGGAYRHVVFDISKPQGSMYPAEIWHKKYRQVDAISIFAGRQLEKEIFNKLWSYCVGREYDMKSYYFFMLRGFLRKLRLSTKYSHDFADPKKGVCVNCLNPILDELSSLGYDLKRLDIKSMTPAMILKEIKAIKMIKYL
jgi:hypothetical protein